MRSKNVMKEEFPVDKLAADESFQNWVMRSNKEDLIKWDKLIASNTYNAYHRHDVLQYDIKI